MEKCKKCGSENVISVEYPHDNPNHYDGISEIACLNCKARFGRWSSKELVDGEFESKYGN